MRSRLRWLVLALVVVFILLLQANEAEPKSGGVSSSAVSPGPVPTHGMRPRRRQREDETKLSALPARRAADERELIQHEVALVGALNDALDLRDAARMRQLLEDYRSYHPNDDNRLQEGYERIVDCLESLDDESRSAAQLYYDDARASTLRRFVRRLCLEAPAS